jgi:hypothetical protein
MSRVASSAQWTSSSRSSIGDPDSASRTFLNSRSLHRRDQLGQGIQDRAQCLGGRDIIAGAAPHRHTGGVGQGRGERRLADTRFAAQEHQPAAAVKRLAEQSLQRGQEARPLDQHTRHYIPAPA